MLAAFSISLPRLGLWSSARVSPDIVSSHDLAAPFPPSGLRRALAIALTTTAIVVQWKSHTDFSRRIPFRRAFFMDNKSSTLVGLSPYYWRSEKHEEMLLLPGKYN